ncbi:MAG: hypothetical protein RLZZ234_256 [Candidatus Parcubacteria bacterium]
MSHTKKASLLGDTPDGLTVIRRAIAGNIATITLVAAVLLGFVFEKEVMPYVTHQGVVAARVIVYGFMLLSCILAVMAQITVVRRGHFIDRLARYVELRGGQAFIDRWARMLAQKSLANPRFIPTLDAAYPTMQRLVTRAGYELPRDYASLLHRKST